METNTELFTVKAKENDSTSALKVILNLYTGNSSTKVLCTEQICSFCMGIESSGLPIFSWKRILLTPHSCTAIRQMQWKQQKISTRHLPSDCLFHMDHNTDLQLTSEALGEIISACFISELSECFGLVFFFLIT